VGWRLACSRSVEAQEEGKAMNDVDRKALAICAQVQRCDDRLGMYSDHEGDENGPAFAFWLKGRRDFELHCLRAIEDHKQAIQVWRAFIKLNRGRKWQSDDNRLKSARY
jgi:hypothetical protein